MSVGGRTGVDLEVPLLPYLQARLLAALVGRPVVVGDALLVDAAGALVLERLGPAGAAASRERHPGGGHVGGLAVVVKADVQLRGGAARRKGVDLVVRRLIGFAGGGEPALAGVAASNLEICDPITPPKG